MESNNKRIARNTLFLYFRMLITMMVSLYTSRVVLNTLGVADFGIYNVVAGLVAMFGFITNTMTSASQRFLAFDIGRNDTVKLKETFGTTVSIYLLFTAVILMLAETLGLWFVCNKLNIPDDRYSATLLVYHFSVATFIISILRIPYNSAIVAHERMGFYAWSSIAEVGLKLIVVFMLVLFDYDKLVLYSILTFVVVLIMTVIYQIYVSKNFSSCRYSFYWNREMFGSMISFAGWNLFDSLANVAKGQGINILLNIYFGATVNAARGIAFQISSQVISFVGNFQIAAAPQITKYYASDHITAMEKLYFQSSRYSYYLLIIISLPILFVMSTILNFWLVDVPEYTLIFAQLVIVNSLIDCMSGTSNIVVQATGHIKRYQLFSGLIMVLNLPLSYLFLNWGYSPTSTFVISIIVSLFIVIARLLIIQSQVRIRAVDYFKYVIIRNIFISAVAIVPLLLLMGFGLISTSSYFYTFLTTGISVVVSVYFLGLNLEERNMVMEFIHKLNK